MYKIYSSSAIPFSSVIEVWKDIEGFEESYQVSSFGGVRSKTRFVNSKNGTLKKLIGKNLKLKVNKGGYLVIHLSKDCERYDFTVHRLVAETFIKNKQNKSTINHKDSDKTNNSVVNLEWSTQREQMIHAVENKLLELRGKPKFSPEFKRRVLDYYKINAVSITQLSVIFSISERSAGRIVNGQCGRNLKITEDSIPLILEMRDGGATLASIARQFNCSISQIHRITRKESRQLSYERN